MLIAHLSYCRNTLIIKKPGTKHDTICQDSTDDNQYYRYHVFFSKFVQNLRFTFNRPILVNSCHNTVLK